MSDGYRIVLRNGFAHLGDDERDGAELTTALAEVDDPDLGTGWCWIAGLYVLAREVVAIEVVV